MPAYPAIVAQGRAWAESRMGAANGASTATVRRKTGKTAQNETTGRLDPIWTDVLTNEPLRIGGFWGSGPSKSADIGAAEVQVSNRVGHFRAAAAGQLRDGDLIDITAGENAGQVFRIVEADWQDQATAYRVPVTATTRPTEWT